MRMKRPSGILLLKIISVLGVALLAASSVYFFLNYRKAQKLLKDPTQAAKEETQLIVGKLSKLMELPDEEPTIATILDKEKLKDQPFFAKAENGDKVVVFNKAMKAVLYRPSINKVIDFAPINLSASEGANLQVVPTPSSTVTPKKPTKTPASNAAEATPTPTPAGETKVTPTP